MEKQTRITILAFSIGIFVGGLSGGFAGYLAADWQTQRELNAQLRAENDRLRGQDDSLNPQGNAGQASRENVAGRIAPNRNASGRSNANRPNDERSNNAPPITTGNPSGAASQNGAQESGSQASIQPVIGPLEDFQDEFDELNDADWAFVAAQASIEEGDLILASSGKESRFDFRRGFQEPFQIVMPFRKNIRPSDVRLPGGYFVRIGGRITAEEGVVHKYGTNVSLHGPQGQIELVGSTFFVRSEAQVLTVKLTEDQIRIYLQRSENNRYLHADTTWRVQPGPCIVHDMETPAYQDWSTPLGLSVPKMRAASKHRYHSFQISEVKVTAGESYNPPAGPVPSLAEDGLKLPEIDSFYSHIGLAFRADGGRAAIDDQDLEKYVSISPFGAPAEKSGSSLDRLHYFLCTFWTEEDWQAWVDHCATAGIINPDIGALRGLNEQDDLGKGGVNLGAPEVREWMKERAERIAAKPEFDGIFFDVCHPYKPPGVTVTDWKDWQGTLYREIWKESLQPRGKYPMINVGNAKTDRNKRIVQWIPIIYLDRQLGGDWQWHEWTVIHNPKYRQELLRYEWISVLDGLGNDELCLDEDIKYGWLTQHYQRLSSLDGYANRHFLGGGFNGDYKSGGGSGRHEWAARHFVPACLYDIGKPVSAVEAVATQSDAGRQNKLYLCEFENALIYHFPRYSGVGKGAAYVVQFDQPHDVLQFDGTWIEGQTSVSIPAGSGRIVKPSTSDSP